MEEENTNKNEILNAVEALPEQFKDVCLLYYSQDIQPKEIARRLNLTVSEVYKKLNRGKFLLKQHFNTEEYQKGMKILYGKIPNRISY